MTKPIQNRIKTLLKGELDPVQKYIRGKRLNSKLRVLRWFWYRYYSFLYSYKFITFKQQFKPILGYLTHIPEVLAFSLCYLATLYLLFNISFTWFNFLASIGFYFVIDEIKEYFLKLMKK